MIRFKGWDWSELSQLEKVANNWPKLPSNFRYDKKQYFNTEDAVNAYLIKKYLQDISYDEKHSKERKRAAKYVRKFCTALSKCRADYSADVYVALSKIENDEVLFGWIIRNLEYMWN